MRLLAIALVAACSSSAVAPSNRGGGSSSPSPTVCRTDDDCTLVETKCCDHCNGGKLEAVLKSQAAAKRPTGCAGTACSARACSTEGAVASCVAGGATPPAGVCKLLIDI